MRNWRVAVDFDAKPIGVLHVLLLLLLLLLYVKLVSSKIDETAEGYILF